MITDVLKRSRLRVLNGLKPAPILTKLSYLKKSEQSVAFNEYCDNRVLFGSFSYGKLNDPNKPEFDRIASARQRLDLYEAGGNAEHLFDVSNLCKLEFEEGAHPKKHFKAVDDGIHVKRKRGLIMGFNLDNEEYSVEFEGVIHETPLAWLLRFDDDREIWVPKSRCSLMLDDDGPGALTAPGWFLDSKEINYMY